MNPIGLLANSLGEHTDKISELLNLVLPIGILLLAFFGLGLYWAWRRWGIYSWKNEQLAERHTYLQGLHDKMTAEKVALFERISDDYVDSKQKLLRREDHVKELHCRLAIRDESLVELRSDNDRLESKLAGTRVGAESKGAEKDATSRDYEDTIARLKKELETKKGVEKKLATLEEQLEPGSGKLVPVGIAAFGEEEKVKEDDKLGIVYKSRPDQIDDLSDIRGVDESIEKALNSQGVYRYKQIAFWDDEQIDRFGEKLANDDHIEKDQWVHQAIDLHYDKYDERLTPQTNIYRKPEGARESGEPSEEDLKHEENALQAFEGESVETHRKYGVVYSEAPSESDDLKKIKGVGKVLEKALNKFGVYRYKQIALWSPRVVREFVEDLPFGDRVTRDNWIEQASELHEEKYGEKVVNY